MPIGWMDLSKPDFSVSCKLRENPDADKGLRVRVSLSPYDVPVAVRAFHDAEHHVYVIDFKYMSDSEQLVEKYAHAHVQVLTGDKSGRLYRIAVNDSVEILQLGNDEVVSTLDQLCQQERAHSWRQAENYCLAKEIIDRNQLLKLAEA